MSVLSVRDLRIAFGSTEVVAGISFDLAAGECLAIVGESGSGKTMTARALLGLSPRQATVTAERLEVGGVSTAAFRERDWRSLRGRVAALVSQDALVSLDPLRRIGREVVEAIEVHSPRDATADRVIELLASVAMPQPEERARQYPHELSGGLRQRALIASALAAKPTVLIADEPTTALDATVQAQILELLAELKAAGLGLLLISHDLSVVRRLADRVAVMRDGVIVETGDAAALFAAPQHPYTRMLLDAAPTARAQHPSPGAPVRVDPVLVARGLSRSYRRPDGRLVPAVDDVSLTVHAGTTLGIVGESGSGKSTLARLLMGLERPDAGEVLLDGQLWSALPERRKRARRGGIQLIDQDPYAAFDPRWSVARVIGEAIDLTGEPRAPRLAELLEQVGLSPALADRRAHELSGGQRQRVAIARALATRPTILVCDEPVSALDVSVQSQVLALLERLQQEQGIALVVISHDLGVIAQLSDEILVMRDGLVVERGPAGEVLGEPRHPFTKDLLEANLF